MGGPSSVSDGDYGISESTISLRANRDIAVVLSVSIVVFSSEKIAANPAESYPRYSNFRSPSRTMPAASFDMQPKMPHISKGAMEGVFENDPVRYPCAKRSILRVNDAIAKLSENSYLLISKGVAVELLAIVPRGH